MSDLYTELLVKKKRTAKDSLIKYGMIGFTAVLTAAGLFSSSDFDRSSCSGNWLLFPSSENRSGV